MSRVYPAYVTLGDLLTMGDLIINVRHAVRHTVRHAVRHTVRHAVRHALNDATTLARGCSGEGRRS